VFSSISLVTGCIQKIILFSIKIRDFLVQEVFVFLLELRERIFFFNLALISLEVKKFMQCFTFWHMK